MSSFKGTWRGLEAIKKMRERELHCLEAMFGGTFYIGTVGHTHTETLWPPTSFREAWMEIKLGLAQSHVLHQIGYTITLFVQILELF